jgi:hypothetical protein
VDGDRDAEQHEPHRHGGPDRRRIGSRDDPGEEASGEQKVRVDESVRCSTVEGRGVQRGEIQRDEPAHVQRQRDDRIGQDVHCTAAQDTADGPARRPGKRAQQQGDRGAEDQAERGDHADEQVLQHVGAEVAGRPGQRAGSQRVDEQAASGEEQHGPPPGPASPVDGGQGFVEQSGGDDGDKKAATRVSHHRSTGTAPRCSTQPNPTRTAPSSRKAMSHHNWSGPPWT